MKSQSIINAGQSEDVKPNRFGKDFDSDEENDANNFKPIAIMPKLVISKASTEKRDKLEEVNLKANQDESKYPMQQEELRSAVKQEPSPLYPSIPYNHQYPNLYQDIVRLEEFKGDLMEFLVTPVPYGKTLMCNIIRHDKNENKKNPKYYLIQDKTDFFLLNAGKKPQKIGKNFLISCEKDNFDKDIPCHLGKFRSNFWGSEFNVFSPGKNPSDTAQQEFKRKQYVGIHYVSF